MRYGSGVATAGADAKATAEQRVARRSRLRVTVDELAGPDTNATSEADVADNGTIALQKLPEPVRVEGLTREQAEIAIRDAYRSAKVVDEPHVYVEQVRGGAAVAQASTQTTSAGNLAATPNRSGQQAAAPPPAPATPTAPLPATTQEADASQADVALPTNGPSDADESLDVVILVQGTPAATTTSTAPATEAVDNAPPATAAPSGAAPAPEPAQTAPPPAPPNAAAEPAPPPTVPDPSPAAPSDVPVK
jgi:hypothetical protein